MAHDGTVSVYMNVAIKTFTTRENQPDILHIPYRLAKKKRKPRYESCVL